MGLAKKKRLNNYWLGLFHVALVFLLSFPWFMRSFRLGKVHVLGLSSFNPIMMLFN